MVFSRSSSLEAQGALRAAWDRWHRMHFSEGKNTPLKPEVARKRRRRSSVHRALDMNGNGPILEEADGMSLSQDIDCSQEVLGSQEFPLSQ